MISKSNENGGFGVTDLKFGGKIYGFVGLKDTSMNYNAYIKAPVAEIPWAGMYSYEGIDFIVDAIEANKELYQCNTSKLFLIQNQWHHNHDRGGRSDVI